MANSLNDNLAPTEKDTRPNRIKDLPAPVLLEGYLEVFQDVDAPCAVALADVQAFFAAWDDPTLPKYLGTLLVLKGKHVWCGHPYAAIRRLVMEPLDEKGGDDA